MNRVFVFVLVFIPSFFSSIYAFAQERDLSAQSDRFVDSVLADELAAGNYQLAQPVVPGNKQQRPIDQTIVKFPLNVAKNFVYLFSANNVRPVLELSAAAGLSHGLLDHEVQEYFHTGRRLGGAAKAGNFIGGSLFTGGTTAALFMLGRFSDDAKFKSMSYSMAQAVVLNGLMTSGIKHGARRLRPDESNHLSFLSGHTSTMFTMSAVLSHYYGWKVGVPAYLASAFVGASRIGSNVHYFSDVTAGAALGYIIGRTVTRHDGFESSRLIWNPIVAPGSKQYGMNLNIRF